MTAASKTLDALPSIVPLTIGASRLVMDPMRKADGFFKSALEAAAGSRQMTVRDLLGDSEILSLRSRGRTRDKFGFLRPYYHRLSRTYRFPNRYPIAIVPKLGAGG